MNIERGHLNSPQMDNLRIFKVGMIEQPVSFIETTHVTADVQCHVYEFERDKTKDLGIIEIEPGRKTPLQEILEGDKTIEGYISGIGALTITKPTGEKQIFPVDPTRKLFKRIVKISDKMQWQSSQDSNLVVYEICIPPYKECRFKNIPE